MRHAQTVAIMTDIMAMFTDYIGKVAKEGDSWRMEVHEKEFIRQTGVKLIVGKGGMGPETVEGCAAHKAVHAVFPGGCAVLAASKVEELERV